VPGKRIRLGIRAIDTDSLTRHSAANFRFVRHRKMIVEGLACTQFMHWRFCVNLSSGLKTSRVATDSFRMQNWMLTRWFKRSFSMCEEHRDFHMPEVQFTAMDFRGYGESDQEQW